MQTVQISAVNTVSRLRFFSTTEEPERDEDTAPPNIDDRPPPLPRCRRISTTRMALVSTSTMLSTSSIMTFFSLNDVRRRD